MSFQRIIIEKQPQFNREAQLTKAELKAYLNYDCQVRVLNVYDLKNATQAQAETICQQVLYTPNQDLTPIKEVNLEQKQHAFQTQYHVGGFNQREDSTQRIINSLLGFEEIEVFCSKIFIFEGLDELQFETVKNYLINPIESIEIELNSHHHPKYEQKQNLNPIMKGFITTSSEDVEALANSYEVYMELLDLEHTQAYFQQQKRDPSVAELKMLETYWSDHCRHTTFLTHLEDIAIEDSPYAPSIQKAYQEYLEMRQASGRAEKPITLMDLATINMRFLKKHNLQKALEDSEENNACSVVIDVEVDDRLEPWLLLFKNETHNHPTEIEPFGGASTCLGGAIRDPLSARAYCYQAMRITGAANPLAGPQQQRSGKLAQQQITKLAMAGYSSYGNQIGIPAGLVKEVYHPGFEAKRMELGALVAGVPLAWVTRKTPEAGDLIVLLGGKTGRDGIGAAVGSSTTQEVDALESKQAEVQKGNPPVERKIVRLFRNPKATKLIKRCNDFGAGGVAVAIGELADGIEIHLDKVPTKYPGLSPMEIALSESQERMAVVIDPKDLDAFVKLALAEDLEAPVVAKVTDRNKVEMYYYDQEIISIDREFINTSGAVRVQEKVSVEASTQPVITNPEWIKGKDFETDYLNNLSHLSTASQKGLAQNFDHTVGGATMFSPYGGRNQMTAQEGMVAKLPVINKTTSTVSLMSYGYDPMIAQTSPFHGGYFAVLDSLTKQMAMGADISRVHLSFQEYFPSLKANPQLWGRPLASLLGAFSVLNSFNLAAIGGKDSMSGSYEELEVPPTLVSFAVSHQDAQYLVSREFKEANHLVVLLENKLDDQYLLDLNHSKALFDKVYELIQAKKVWASSTIPIGGIHLAIAQMAMGNGIGFTYESLSKDYFKPMPGSLLLEIEASDLHLLEAFDPMVIGKTNESSKITLNGYSYKINELIASHIKPLNSVFPLKENDGQSEAYPYFQQNPETAKDKLNKVKVLIPVYMGTTGEYDLAAQFEKAGAQVEVMILKEKVDYQQLAQAIDKVQILALPHGYSLGNEPELAGKVMELILREASVQKAIEALLQRDGLILGIGSGMATLLNLGLLTSGKYQNSSENKVLLTYNQTNNFVSRLVHLEVTSNRSPWFRLMQTKDQYSVPFATDQGRLVLAGLDNQQGQLVTRYIALENDGRVDGYNPSGSSLAVESICSPCGRIIGFTTSIDRVFEETLVNEVSLGKHRIFESGVSYFTNKEVA